MSSPEHTDSTLCNNSCAFLVGLYPITSMCVCSQYKPNFPGRLLFHFLASTSWYFIISVTRVQIFVPASSTAPPTGRNKNRMCVGERRAMLGPSSFSPRLMQTIRDCCGNHVIYLQLVYVIKKTDYREKIRFYKSCGTVIISDHAL